MARSIDYICDAAVPFNISGYLDRVVGRLYKILPLKESGEVTINEYLDGLKSELIGVEDFCDLHGSPMFISVIGIVSYLAGDIDNCEVKKVKREVFRAINLCKRVADNYREGGVV